MLSKDKYDSASILNLLENLPDLVYIYDLVKETNEYANKPMYAYLGYTAEEFRSYGGGFLFQSIHPEERNLVVKHLNALKYLPSNQMMEVTYRIKHKKGHYLWLNSKDVPYERNTQGQVTKVLGMATEVSQIKSQVEEARQSRNLLLHTLKHINSAIYSADAEGNFTFLSEKAKELLNTIPLALITKPHLGPEVFGEANWARRKQAFNTLKPGEEVSLEFMLHGPPQHEKWLIETIKRLGKVENEDLDQEYFGTFQDITPRKIAERELATSRQLLELSVKASNDGIWNYSQGNAKFTFSSRWYEILGYEVDDLGNTLDVWLDLLHPEDRQQAYQKALDDFTYKDRYDDNYRLRHKKGYYVDVINRALFIRGTDGDVEKVVGSITDISSIKDSERKLLNSEQQLKEAQKLSKISHWSYDLKSQELKASKWFFEILGIRNTKLQEKLRKNPKRLMDFISREDFGRLQELLNPNRPEIDDFEHTLKMVVKHRILYLQIRTSLEKDKEGRTQRIKGTMQDVTEQKIREEELEFAKKEADEASKAKTQFLNTMSHEIRTPLNAIIGMSYVLLNDNHSQEQKENLEILKQSSEHLMDLINNILDFNRIESGNITFEEEIIQTNSFFRQILALWKPLAEVKNLKLQLELPSSIPEALITDPLRLTQVLNNLLNNAIKFTETGSITLKLSILSSHNDKIKLRIAVIDTGIGIEQEKQKEIFGLFTQVHERHNRKYGGSGLGLAICTKLLNYQGSQLLVNSKENEGSSFYFDLNFGLVEDPVSDPKSEASKARMVEKLRGVKVLLVEDNFINRQVMERFFKGWENDYQMAESGPKALHILNTYRPDIILMDIQMPEMDGYETSQKIRGMEDEFFQKVPIIALTASSMMDSRDKLQLAGMNALIEKPFSPEKLFKVIQSSKQG